MMSNYSLSIISKRTSGFILLVGIFAIMISQIVVNESFYIVIAEILLLALSVLFLYRLEWGLLLFLLIRPSIDRQAEYFSIGLGDNFSLNVAAVFGVLIIIFFGLYFAKYFKIFSKLPLKIVWASFLIVLFIGIFYSIDQLVSIYEFIRIISIFAIFALVFLLVQNKTPIKHILYAILYSAIIPFSSAVYQIIFGSGLGSTPGVESRVYGTFSHPSPFALYVLTIAAISFFVIVSNRKLVWPYLFFFPAVTILLFTFTRGAWIALVVFLAIIGFMKSPKILIGLITVSLILFFGSITVHDRIEDIYNPPSDSSIRWRFKQWENMFDVSQNKPVLGYGTGTEAVVHYYNFGLDAGNPYTHNDFLKMTVENGLIGLIAFITLIISTIVLLLQRYYKMPSSQLKDLILVTVALFIVFAMVAIGDNVLRSTATQWVLWTLVAVTLTYSKMDNKKLKQEKIIQ